MTNEYDYLDYTIHQLNGWFSLEEGRAMHQWAKNLTGKGVIVEIGSWQGKSTICLGNGSLRGQKTMIYAIDPHTGSTEHHQEKGQVWTFDQFKKNIEQAQVDSIVHPIVKMSWDAAIDFHHPIELIFIDGAHDYESVTRDFNDWFPKVVEGGLMTFHDSTWEGVRRMLKEKVYFSPYFKNIGMVLGTTYATKVSSNTWWDRMVNRCKWYKFIVPLEFKEWRRRIFKKN